MLFVIAYFLPSKISGLIQSILITLNGLIVYLIGERYIGVLFIICAAYSFCLCRDILKYRKARYIILPIIVLIADIIKSFIDKRPFFFSFGYMALFISVMIFIDWIVTEIVEKEKQRVRDEMNELSSLVKRLDITTSDIIKLLEREKENGK